MGNEDIDEGSVTESGQPDEQVRELALPLITFGQLGPARALLEQALKMEPGAMPVRLTYAVCLQEMGMSDRAAAIAQELWLKLPTTVLQSSPALVAILKSLMTDESSSRRSLGG